MMSEKPFPHSLDAERAVLGSIIIAQKETWGVVASKLTAEHFYRDAHQKIFAAMASLLDEGCNIDYLTLSEYLRTRGLLDDVGGPVYLSGLGDGVPRSTNVDHYTDIVVDCYHRRQLLVALAKYATRIYEQEPIASIVDLAVSEIASVSTSKSVSVSLEAGARAYLDDLRSETRQPLPTGYLDVDRILGGGMRRGMLFIVAARPSVGKTTWALKVAQSAATAGTGVVFFSLELGVKPVSGRILSWIAGVPQPRIDSGTADSGEMETVTAGLEEVTGLPLWVDDSAQTVPQIQAVLQRVQNETGVSPAVVILDYIQLIAAERARASITEEVTGLSRALKRLAQTEDVVVIALSQLSRASEGRKDKRPYLSDLRDSGALEQDADTVALLFREELYNPNHANEGMAEVIVAKNRLSGRTGTIRLRFDREMARFQDLEESYADDEFLV